MSAQINHFGERKEIIQLLPFHSRNKDLNNGDIKYVEKEIVSVNSSNVKRREARDLLEYADLEGELSKDQDDQASFSVLSWWKNNNWKKSPSPKPINLIVSTAKKPAPPKVKNLPSTDSPVSEASNLSSNETESADQTSANEVESPDQASSTNETEPLDQTSSANEVAASSGAKENITESNKPAVLTTCLCYNVTKCEVTTSTCRTSTEVCTRTSELCTSSIEVCTSSTELCTSTANICTTTQICVSNTTVNKTLILETTKAGLEITSRPTESSTEVISQDDQGLNSALSGTSPKSIQIHAGGDIQGKLLLQDQEVGTQTIVTVQNIEKLQGVATQNIMPSEYNEVQEGEGIGTQITKDSQNNEIQEIGTQSNAVQEFSTLSAVQSNEVQEVGTASTVQSNEVQYVSTLSDVLMSNELQAVSTLSSVLNNEILEVSTQRLVLPQIDNQEGSTQSIVLPQNIEVQQETVIRSALLLQDHGNHSVTTQITQFPQINDAIKENSTMKVIVPENTLANQISSVNTLFIQNYINKNNVTYTAVIPTCQPQSQKTISVYMPTTLENKELNSLCNFSLAALKKNAIEKQSTVTDILLKEGDMHSKLNFSNSDSTVANNRMNITSPISIQSEILNFSNANENSITDSILSVKTEISTATINLPLNKHDDQKNKTELNDKIYVQNSVNQTSANISQNNLITKIAGKRILTDFGINSYNNNNNLMHQNPLKLKNNEFFSSQMRSSDKCQESLSEDREVKPPINCNLFKEQNYENRNNFKTNGQYLKIKTTEDNDSGKISLMKHKDVNYKVNGQNIKENEAPSLVDKQRVDGSSLYRLLSPDCENTKVAGNIKETKHRKQNLMINTDYSLKGEINNLINNQWQVTKSVVNPKSQQTNHLSPNKVEFIPEKTLKNNPIICDKKKNEFDVLKNNFNYRLDQRGIDNGAIHKNFDSHTEFQNSFSGDFPDYEEQNPELLIVKPRRLVRKPNNYKISDSDRKTVDLRLDNYPNADLRKEISNSDEENRVITAEEKEYEPVDYVNSDEIEDSMSFDGKVEVSGKELDSIVDKHLSNKGDSMISYIVLPLPRRLGKRSSMHIVNPITLPEKHISDGLYHQKRNSIKFADINKTPNSIYTLKGLGVPEIFNNITYELSDPIPLYRKGGKTSIIRMSNDSFPDLINFNNLVPKGENVVNTSRNTRNTHPDGSLSDVIKFHLMHGIFAPDGKELLKALKEAKYQMQKVNMEFHPEITRNPMGSEVPLLLSNGHALSKKQAKSSLTIANQQEVLKNQRNSEEESHFLPASAVLNRSLSKQELHDKLRYIRENNKILNKLRQETELETDRLVEPEQKRWEEETLFNKEREQDVRERQAIQELLHEKFLFRNDISEMNENAKYYGDKSGKDVKSSFSDWTALDNSHRKKLSLF